MITCIVASLKPWHKSSTLPTAKRPPFRPSRSHFPRGVNRQGSPEAGSLIHFDDTDPVRIRLGLTDTAQPLCRNGNYHILFSKTASRVTCPACLTKMAP
jgi:hypothetical protein